MTTYTPPPEAVEAAAAAFADAWVGVATLREGVRAALTAAGPLIERAAADRAAEDITAAMNEPALINLADRYGGYYQGQRSGLERAASIARGEES